MVLLAAAASVMALSLVLTMSRSGILAFVASGAVSSWWLLRRLPGRHRLAVAGSFAGVVALAVGWTGVDTVAARLGSGDVATINDRLPIWRDAWRIASDFWLTGTGLNTFGVATLFYQTSLPGLHLREAHNDYLQLASEGGLMLSLPLVGLLVVFARETRRRFADAQGSSYWIRLGAVTGLVTVALQSTVEFSLQMPGNAALFAALCGIALHRDPRSVVRGSPDSYVSPASRRRN